MSLLYFYICVRMREPASPVTMPDLLEALEKLIVILIMCPIYDAGLEDECVLALLGAMRVAS